ncbi:MAG: crotonobetainyl-CoA:carnitine CoA-transferase CaiB-like acyl-CoA transferase [Myxococcota bacterium]|jgi:crotonobetainyl-CoA:carnitine CoA-transferase CaiB-like acyl-CoA transferase
MNGPLSGYRILEITTTVSGPMAAMVLADQGAEVIKIEPPLVGDPARFLGSSREGTGALFAVLNRNKRSLPLDLKDEKDLRIFLELAKKADVLIENYRPGVVEKLGIDYGTLAKTNPGLVYASISGYGQSGPYKNRRVFDPLIQATAGVSHDQGQGTPKNVRTIMFDKVTALTAAQVVTAALLERAKTGRGQHLPISMLDSALYYTWPDLMWSRTLQGDDIQHVGELGDWLAPIFKAKDGHVSIVLVADPAFELLCVWRNSSLHEDPRFKTFLARQQNAEALIKEVEAIIATITTDELCNNLDAFGVPVARINSLDEVHLDPQVQHAQSLVETKHPVLGDMRFARPPVQFDPQEVFPTRHAPFLGEHTREILSELAVDESEIKRLEERDIANREVMRGVLAAAAAAALAAQDSGE